MIKRSLMGRLAAAMLIVALQGLYAPAPAAQSSAKLSGTIFSATDEMPLDGARLHVGDPHTGEIFSSTPTSVDGSFFLPDLPPASYEVAVELGGGLYVVGAPVELVAGQDRRVHLAVDAQETAPAPEDSEKKKKKKGGAGFWENPLTAALVVIGAAIIIGALLSAGDDDEPDVSPFTAPSN